MISRRALAVSGAIAIALYVASAAASGNLSVLARRPLLDGTLPPVPYRWVDPPPALAPDNVAPTPGSFRVAVGDEGTRTDVLTTEDVQVTIILARGAIETPPGTRAVAIEVTPLAASEVQPVEPPREIVGNVVRIDATALPSGAPIREIDGEVRVVLYYPGSADPLAGHTIVTSPDGVTWTANETNDLPSVHQADAVLPSFGYVAAAQEPGASPTPEPTGVNTTATIAIVAGIVVLLAAVVVTLRGRRGTTPEPRTPRGEAKRPVTPEQRRKRRRH